jgi:hypothetical protein
MDAIITTDEIERAFHDWWLDSYKRPPTAQALMTHVAFARHVLALAECLETTDD